MLLMFQPLDCENVLSSLELEDIYSIEKPKHLSNYKSFQSRFLTCHTKDTKREMCYC